MRHTTINAVDHRGKHVYFIKKQGQGFKLPFSLLKIESINAMIHGIKMDTRQNAKEN
jgi:hypothetical protein